MFFRCLNTQALPQLRKALSREVADFAIYELDGKSIHDKRSLFEAIRLNVPYDKNQRPSVGLSWSAFADNLMFGLKEKGDPWAAILWHDAQVMIEGNLQLLLEFVEIVKVVGQELYRDERGVVLQVFLLGDGPNFPDYPEDGRVFGIACMSPVVL